MIAILSHRHTCHTLRKVGGKVCRDKIHSIQCFGTPVTPVTPKMEVGPTLLCVGPTRQKGVTGVTGVPIR